MISKLILAAFCIAGTAANAKTMKLEILLHVDSVGWDDVQIHDVDNVLIDKFAFVAVEDNPWGLYRDFNRFNTGDTVKLISWFDSETGDASRCVIGGFDCHADYGGGVYGDAFRFSAGSGGTRWGDFVLRGGNNVGDTAEFHTFGGARAGHTLTDENGKFSGHASWDTDLRNFTVTQSTLAPIPLPASSVLLIAALGSLGAMRRTKGRQS